MREVINNLGLFAARVISKWAVLATGGVVVAAESMWSALVAPLPPKLFILTVTMFLITAIYKVWLDEHEEVGKLRQELLSRSVPIIRAEINECGAAPATSPQDTNLLVPIEVLNTGATTSLRSWTVSVILPGNDAEPIQANVIRLNVESVSLTAEDGVQRSVRMADEMVTKSERRQLGSNDRMHGFLMAHVAGISVSELYDKKATVRVNFQDVPGNTHSASFTFEGREQFDARKISPNVLRP